PAGTRTRPPVKQLGFDRDLTLPTRADLIHPSGRASPEARSGPRCGRDEGDRPPSRGATAGGGRIDAGSTGGSKVRPGNGPPRQAGGAPRRETVLHRREANR